MECLTSDNLVSFIEKAQCFLRLGPVDVFHRTIWDGRGLVTVEAVQQGNIHLARFNLEGAIWDVAALSDNWPYETFYQFTNTRLFISSDMGKGATNSLAFRLC